MVGGRAIIQLLICSEIKCCFQYGKMQDVTVVPMGTKYSGWSFPPFKSGSAGNALLRADIGRFGRVDFKTQVLAFVLYFMEILDPLGVG